MAFPAIFAALAPILGKVIDNAIPDPKAKAELQLELAKLADADAQREHDASMGQIEVNKVEAAHRSIWVAGWRPAIGWVGAASLAIFYIVQPAVQLAHGEPVSIDTSELMVLLANLLGFGALRTFDKARGTANDAPLGKPVTPDMPILGQNAGKVREKLKL